ncbi:hypothetical protein N2152v2_008441 [Parachlorella kessleri]
MAASALRLVVDCQPRTTLHTRDRSARHCGSLLGGVKRCVAIGAAAADQTQQETTTPDGAQPLSPRVASGNGSELDLISPSFLRVPFGFTKSNELLIGRVSLFALSAALVGELITGQGPITYLKFETGIPNLWVADKAVLFLIGFNLVAGLLPARGRFVADKEPPGWRKGAEPGKYIGSGQRGITKEEELSLGRMAQLMLSVFFTGELLSGKGALGLLEIETGVPACEAEPLVIIFVSLMLLAAINPGSGRFVEK